MNKIFFCNTLQPALLLFLLLLFGASSLAQTQANETNNQVSLQSVSEAMLISGLPALRIQFRNNQTSEIRLEKRDGEDALVFNVLKIINSVGKLYVTKTKLTYIPNDNPDKFFKIEKSKIKEVRFKDHWRLNKGLSNVNINYEGDEKAFSLTFPQKGDQQILLAGNQFLYRAINDFDAALVEFNQLTSSVRPASEEEEEIEQEEEAIINDKYDRFRDITVVSTSKMLVRGSKRSIRTYASYSFEGKTQKTPDKVLLYFYASATRPVFSEDGLDLNFLVDDNRLPVGKMKLSDEEKTKTSIKQTVVITVSYKLFEQIANGKKVEFQIGTLEYKLTDVHLENFRRLLSYKIEE